MKIIHCTMYIDTTHGTTVIRETPIKVLKILWYIGATLKSTLFHISNSSLLVTIECMMLSVTSHDALNLSGLSTFH